MTDRLAVPTHLSRLARPVGLSLILLLSACTVGPDYHTPEMATPAQFKAALTASRAQLLQLMADSEVAMRNLEASAQNLSLHGAALTVVAKLAGGALDVTVSDALIQRRTLIQQAVRQAELSILQMGQVRQQAADLIGQVSSFLTVTLPALEMAQAQGGS